MLLKLGTGESSNRRRAFVSCSTGNTSNTICSTLTGSGAMILLLKVMLSIHRMFYVQALLALRALLFVIVLSVLVAERSIQPNQQNNKTICVS